MSDRKLTLDELFADGRAIDEALEEAARDARRFHKFLFRLKSPRNAIGGFGFVQGFAKMAEWWAWECFGEGNGAPTEEAFNCPRPWRWALDQPKTASGFPTHYATASRVLVRPRLGQGGFRVAVTDAYGRACAVTGEHSLPVLEAAHIRPYSKEGPHAISNGLLLRSDLHRLFDTGYVTVTPTHRLEVSKRLRDDFQNGRSYYPLHSRVVSIPRRRADRPDAGLLAWHNENVFRD
jgi:hypothetical protein